MQIIELKAVYNRLSLKRDPLRIVIPSPRSPVSDPGGRLPTRLSPRFTLLSSVLASTSRVQIYYTTVNDGEALR